jgi:hypothetical protein
MLDQQELWKLIAKSNERELRRLKWLTFLDQASYVASYLLYCFGVFCIGLIIVEAIRRL